MARARQPAPPHHTRQLSYRILHPPSLPGCWCRDCFTDPVAFDSSGRGICQFHVPIELLSPDGPTLSNPNPPP